MASCNFNQKSSGKTCDRVATTTLLKNNGEVVQLCEKHREQMIRLFKLLAEDGVKEANHWLVLNKIPS